MKVYRDPRRPHSYLECRVRDDRDLYPRPHITHRNGRSPSPPLKKISFAGLAASIQGEAFYIIRVPAGRTKRAPLICKAAGHFGRDSVTWTLSPLPPLSFSFSTVEGKARTKRVDNTESSSLQRKTAQKAPKARRDKLICI